jgi:peptidase M28-like protein
VLNATLGLFEALEYKSYDPHHLAPPTTPYVRDWYNNMPQAQANLQAAKAAAAIGILDLGPSAAQGSYFPYDGLIRAIPGIYVDRVVGAQLRQVAAAAGTVRVELEAHVANVNSRNVLGVIPGASKELVAINCHTDGTNGLEDNGPIAIIAIAQYLARIPRHQLPRTILVLLTTGHFAGGIGARTFISHHRHDLVPRIAAGVTIEHLGAQEWLPNASGELEATGAPEVAAVFGAPNRALLDAAATALAQAKAAPAFVIPPLNRNPHGADNDAAWPGEGSYLWRWSSTSGGIPDANYITGPTYLLNGGIKTIDKIDFTRMRNEGIAFTQMLLKLSRIAPRTLSRIDIPE